MQADFARFISENYEAKSHFQLEQRKRLRPSIYKTLKEDQFEISLLLTSINKEFQRISIHGVHISLLEKQAESLGLNLIKIELPKEPSIEEYRDIMNKTMNEIKS